MLASIGAYRVIDRVGAGGMGTVYRVAHRRTGRVALPQPQTSQPGTRGTGSRVTRIVRRS